MPAASEFDLALRAIAESDEAPSLSRYVEREATAEQVLEFLVHRSAYQLKEADPHTWAIPRLTGAPKAALVEIQADEYGGGRPDRLHAALFAKTMRAAGLDDTYGAYLDRIPGVTLAGRESARARGCRRRTAATATFRIGTAPRSRPIEIALPSWSCIRNGPRTSSGPSR